MPANWVEVGGAVVAAHPKEVKFGVGNMKILGGSVRQGDPSPSWRPNINAYMEAERSGTSTPSTSRPSSPRPSRPTTSWRRDRGRWAVRQARRLSGSIEQGFAVPHSANSVPVALGGLTVTTEPAVPRHEARHRGPVRRGQRLGQFSQAGVDYPPDVSEALHRARHHLRLRHRTPWRPPDPRSLSPHPPLLAYAPVGPPSADGYLLGRRRGTEAPALDRPSTSCRSNGAAAGQTDLKPL